MAAGPELERPEHLPDAGTAGDPATLDGHAMDGVPGITQAPVAPGTACTTLTRAGSGAGTSAPAGAPATSGRHAAASAAESRRIPTTPPWPHNDVVPNGTPALT